MPTYVYGCPESNDHPRKEVVHKMAENPVIKCDTCGTVMHRIPQSIRFYMSPYQVLTDWCDENWRRYKARKQGRRAERFSPDVIMSPSPLAGKDFEHRRAKPNVKQTRS